MFVPLGVKTDYSLHKSLLKISDIIKFSNENNLKCIGILDDNLNSSYTFVLACLKNNIKPIVGLDFIFNDKHIYLYPKNRNGLSNLFKLNKYLIDNKIDLNNIKGFLEDVIVVLPFESINLYKDFNDAYLSFKNDNEMNQLLKISNKVIYINYAFSYNVESSKYVNYLYMHENNLKLNNYVLKDYSNYVLEIKDYDLSEFVKNIDLKIENNQMYIPKYIDNSFEYLTNLSKKGLSKRLNDNVPLEYSKRLNYELNVIKEMGFVDYFLIVFDYVRFAIKNKIYVGVGRGSAVSSLVAYSLGITNIDPLKYNLLFERFLNPKRITMPDIDIDFEDTRRGEVIKYVENKYGISNVARIIAYGTLASREVLRVVGKINDVDDKIISFLTKSIDSSKNLKENLENEKIKDLLNRNSKLKKIYNESLYLEGLKSHISTHAAGLVISSVDLTDLVPIIKSGNDYLIGYSKDEIESLGLIKMDFLSVRALTIITNTLNYLPNLNLNNINLEDPNIYKMFASGDTTGIFQFESYGMRDFLKKLKPKCFNDLILAIAVYRPGPMEYIPKYLENRRIGKVQYLDESLESILGPTLGILVYQEQILEILSKLGNYSYQEADVIRKAISKKNMDIISKNRSEFINRSNLDKDIANKIFDMILPFSSFGFNKSHATAYAIMAYQMAYLRCYYKEYFYMSILNNDINNVNKRVEYINLGKKEGLQFLNPDINKSNSVYSLEENKIRIPLNVIKGLTSNQIDYLMSIRKEEFLDIYDLFKKIDQKIINSKAMNAFILSGALSSFNFNRMTIKNNLDTLYNYADLVNNLGDDLVSKPILKYFDGYSNVELMNLDLEYFGFYLVNHPSNKYTCPKLININNYFNKVIEIYVLIDNIKKIKTKNDKDMAFIDIEDETSSGSVTVFDDKIHLLNNININDFVKICGRVERRFDKYNIIINNIEKES